jgi:hypothetical protein
MKINEMKFEKCTGLPFLKLLKLCRRLSASAVCDKFLFSGFLFILFLGFRFVFALGSVFFLLFLSSLKLYGHPSIGVHEC